MGGDCRGSGREWDGEEQRGLIPGGLKSNHKTNMIIEIQIEKRGSRGECVRRGSAEVRAGEKAWQMKCDLSYACNTQQYTLNEKNGARNTSVIRLGAKFDLKACSGKYIHNFLKAVQACITAKRIVFIGSLVLSGGMFIRSHNKDTESCHSYSFFTCLHVSNNRHHCSLTLRRRKLSSVSPRRRLTDGERSTEGELQDSPLSVSPPPNPQPLDSYSSLNNI